MRSLRLVLIIAVMLAVTLVCGPASAKGFRGSGHREGYHMTGAHRGYYGSREHRGGYYRSWAHRGHYRGGLDVVIGGYWGPWWDYGWPYSYYPYYPGFYYPYYPYYYAPSEVVPVAPPTYIEREKPEPAQTSKAWPQDWFYCPGSRSFYPYVKECPSGWKTVPATPPSGSGNVTPLDSSAPSGVWYYCQDSKAYYPYIQKCPGGWKTVPASPSGAAR